MESAEKTSWELANIGLETKGKVAKLSVMTFDYLLFTLCKQLSVGCSPVLPRETPVSTGPCYKVPTAHGQSQVIFFSFF